MEKTKPYPLKFEPLLIPKVWGGGRIATIGQGRSAGEGLIGESWEFVDLPDRSSVVSHGPMRGKTFAQCLAHWGESLVSDVALSGAGGFPLLVKLLDARESLSIQVHPSSSTGSKTEAIYILEADDDAVLYRGFKQAVTHEQVRKAAEDGTIVDLMEQVPVRAGNCYFIPGGTCHAYGAGLLGVEIQTPSETTYRLWDWGRTDREMHVEEALGCMDLHSADVEAAQRRTHVAGTFTSMSLLCSCDAFTIEKVRMREPWQQEIPYDRPALWVVLEGSGKISHTPAGIDVPFGAGDVVFIPGQMEDAKVEIESDAQWLDVQIPRTGSDIRLA